MSLLEQFMKEDNNDHTKQGSDAWHEWRSKHIGASEIPAIMGTCDFKGIYQLWLEKTGQVEKFKGNWATRRGHEYEPIAREEYSQITGNKVEDKVLEYEAWPILSASLDGFVAESSTVVEIKTPSKAKHQLALSGSIPDTYKDQIQAQLLVAGVSRADYVSYAPGEADGVRVAIVKVEADPERQAAILERAKFFWQCVETNTPPVDIVEQPELKATMEKYRDITNSIDTLEKQLEDLREEIKKQIKADKVTCEGWTISWGTRKGNVDYAKIPELKEVDLNKYRKPDSRVFTIKEK